MLNFDNMKILSYADNYILEYIKNIVIAIMFISLSFLIYFIIEQKISKEPKMTNYERKFVIRLISFGIFIGSIIATVFYKAPYLNVYVEAKPTNILTLSEMKKQKEYFKEINGNIYFLHTVDKLMFETAKEIHNKDQIMSETQKAFKEVIDPLWFDSKIK